MKLVFLALFSLFICNSNAKAQELNYFLPDVKYNKDIRTPKDFFGYAPGEWHADFYQIHAYMKYLGEASDRVDYYEYGKTHEMKPNFILKISTAENLAKQEEIRKNHITLCDPNQSKMVNTKQLPALVYQAHTVHGNEPSGLHAAIYMAYYYAACEEADFKEQLKNLFILLEPCMNPDGYQRFASWVNMHKSHHLISDPRAREFNENWPGSRTNHYWFDLNRDWLHLTQPESQGRINLFHAWRPNVLTDHHEMGTNATYFFQPGVPARTNPNTPDLNWKLTEKIGQYHGRFLDGIGSLYYSQTQFDDFFYGKGSTFPDIHGCIGILFEQASSRGHLQNSINGPVSFAFTIRNQIYTSLSTIQAASEMRTELNDYKKNFYINKRDEALKFPVKAYIFTDTDPQKAFRFADLLHKHQIELSVLERDISVKERSYQANKTYVVKTDQPQFGLIKSIFEDVKEFKDSIFYDVSAWTVPFAYGIDFQALNASETSAIRSKKIEKPIPVKAEFSVDASKKPLAYVINWKQMYAGKALYELLASGIKCKVTTEPTQIDGVPMDRGSILIPLQIQDIETSVILTRLQHLSEKLNLNILPIYSGYHPQGISLGHPGFRHLEAPKCFMIVGNGVTSYQAGEVWHFMDHHLGSSIAMIDKNQLSGADLNAYNTLILASGSYADLSDLQQKKLEDWIKAGNTVIAFQNAISWLKSKNWINLTDKSTGAQDSIYSGIYARMSEERGSRVLGGAIFKAKGDLTHPLMYGYPEEDIYVFKNNTQIYQLTKNRVATPLRLADRDCLASGYLPKNLKNIINNSVSISTHSSGRGRIVCFVDNPIFRAQWLSGYKMVENAIFFSSIIDGQAFEK